MKLTPERIVEIKAAVEAADSFATEIIDVHCARVARTAIPELLAEREEREAEMWRLEDANKHLKKGSVEDEELRVTFKARADTAESANAALREENERLEKTVRIAIEKGESAESLEAYVKLKYANSILTERVEAAEKALEAVRGIADDGELKCCGTEFSCADCAEIDKDECYVTRLRAILDAGKGE